MKRRRIMSGAGYLALAGLGCGPSRAANQPDQPVYKVSLEQLQRGIAAKFPARYSVGNLLDLELETPRLRLLPKLNRLASEMVLDAAGPALRRKYRGSFDVDFALRYEPSDQSMRAHQLGVHSFRVPGLQPQMLQLLEVYAQALAEQALLEVVLHRLGPRDLALPDAMGLQPGDITVASDGVVIAFVAKQSR